MVVFTVGSPSFAVAAVALASAHGVADVDTVVETRSVAPLLPYALLFAPLPTSLTTLSFVCASVFHFGSDFGLRWSVSLHAVAAVLYAVHGVAPAAAVVTTYYCLLHVPLCYLRLARAGRTVALTACAVTTAAVGVVVSATSVHAECVQLTDAMQRLVLAHVLVNM